MNGHFPTSSLHLLPLLVQSYTEERDDFKGDPKQAEVALRPEVRRISCLTSMMYTVTSDLAVTHFAAQPARSSIFRVAICQPKCAPAAPSPT